MGVSYKSDKHPSDQKGVAALSPMVCKSARENASLSVPCAKAMGQSWLDNDGNSPGAVIVANTTTADIHIWVTYRVVFNGPTAVAQTSGFDIIYRHDGTTWFDEAGNVVNNANVDDMYGELEIGGSQSTLQTAWESFSRVVRTARELHRAWSVSIGLVHFLAAATNIVLPVLGAPAILHLQQRPFRATLAEWRLLGFDPAEQPPETGECFVEITKP